MLPADRHRDATLERMDYGRELKGTLPMQEKRQRWVPYPQPLLDAVRLFDELGIGYALIGGVAAMHYGRSRFTEDVRRRRGPCGHARRVRRSWGTSIFTALENAKTFDEERLTPKARSHLAIDFGFNRVGNQVRADEVEFAQANFGGEAGEGCARRSGTVVRERRRADRKDRSQEEAPRK